MAINMKHVLLEISQHFIWCCGNKTLKLNEFQKNSNFTEFSFYFGFLHFKMLPKVTFMEIEIGPFQFVHYVQYCAHGNDWITVKSE